MEYEIGEDEHVSTAVVRAVSATTERDLCSLPQLAAVVDPDALDRLFEPRADGTARTGGRLLFIYCDHRIDIENAESIVVKPIISAGRSSFQ